MLTLGIKLVADRFMQHVLRFFNGFNGLKQRLTFEQPARDPKEDLGRLIAMHYAQITIQNHHGRGQ